MQTVYVDSVFCFNALADYLLLHLTASFAGLRIGRKRIFLSALFGGAYALAAAVWQSPCLSPPVKIAVSLLMVRFAFGKAPLFLRRWLFFLAVSAAFSGFTVMLSAFATRGKSGSVVPFDFFVFLAATGLAYFLLSVCFRGSGEATAKNDLTEARLKIGEREWKFRTLLDSGCTLKDTRTGKPVLIVERTALADVPYVPTGEIQFESLGGGGAMQTFYADCLSVGKTDYASPLIAVAPEGVCFGDGYRAIFGKE